MSCDISQVFSSIVGTIRSSETKPNPNNIEPKLSKDSSPNDTQNEFTFASRACGLRSNLQVLSGYLKRIHQLTAGTIGNRFKQRIYSELTNQVAQLIDQCTILLTQLHDVASLDESDFGLKESHSQLSSHRLAVYRSLHEELGKLKQIRDVETDRQRHLLKLTGTLASGIRSISLSSQNGSKFDTFETDVRKRTSVTKIQPSGDPLLLNEPDGENTRRQQENEFTDADLKALETENVLLMNQLDREGEEVHHVARSITEIGRLNQTMSEHLVMQLEQTEQISDQTVAATENIRLANEQLREAMNRKASVQSCLLFVLIVFTFSLHFLDWYYP